MSRAQSLGAGKSGLSLASATYYMLLKSDFPSQSICFPLYGTVRPIMHFPQSKPPWREPSDPLGAQLKLANIHDCPITTLVCRWDYAHFTDGKVEVQRR